MVPSPLDPPNDVVPYKFPEVSIVKALGWGDGMLPSNDARVWIWLLPFTSSNTVPAPDEPPLVVVPYKLPLLSQRTPVKSKPTVESNDARVWIWLLPFGT